MLYHLSHQGSPYKETNHLPKAPSPNTITYEVKILIYEYGGDIQSIEPPHFLLLPLNPKLHEGKDFVCCVFCCVSSAKQWIVCGRTPLVSVDWMNVSLCRSPQWHILRTLRNRKPRTLASDSWRVCQRNDFREPKLLYLPHTQKSTKFLNLRCPVFFNEP